METINKLYLELSNIATAETAKEIRLQNKITEMKAEIEAIKKINNTVHFINKNKYWIPNEVYKEIEKLKGENNEAI